MTCVISALSRKISLLTISNPKIKLSLGVGFATAGLHLAPAWASGHNTCASHTPECAAACLNTSGHGAFAKVQEARIRRTKFYFDDQPAFLAQLRREIEQFILNAESLKITPCFRLNLTSDIRWELHGIPQAYPSYQWYDYTKLTNRKNIPPNYHLTYSFSGHNFKQCETKLKEGTNIAVPFKIKPQLWMGHQVIDGDAHDLRFLDPPSSIVGLKLKGRLRADTSSAFLGDSHPHLIGSSYQATNKGLSP